MLRRILFDNATPMGVMLLYCRLLALRCVKGNSHYVAVDCSSKFS